MSSTANQSICIPRTIPNVTRAQIKETFETITGTGTVVRVDIVNKTSHDNQPFIRIFVHFRYWPTKVHHIRDRLIAGETIKVVYDNPWFWKCSMSRVSKPEDNRPKAVPYVEFSPKKSDATDVSKSETTDVSKSETVNADSTIHEVSNEELAERSSWGSEA